MPSYYSDTSQVTVMVCWWLDKEVAGLKKRGHSQPCITNSVQFVLLKCCDLVSHLPLVLPGNEQFRKFSLQYYECVP